MRWGRAAGRQSLPARPPLRASSEIYPDAEEVTPTERIVTARKGGCGVVVHARVVAEHRRGVVADLVEGAADPNRSGELGRPAHGEGVVRGRPASRRVRVGDVGRGLGAGA